MALNKYGGACNENNPDKQIYNLWYGMLRRCYDTEQHKRSRGKSYADCEVCDRWFDYTNFAQDIALLPGYEDWLHNDDYCLDKDTINPGNRIYNPDNCCFVSRADNIRDIHNRKPQNIERLHELNKVKYKFTKGDDILIFNSEKEACEYMGVAQCSVASCYRRGNKCKGYTITKIDGGTEK